MSPRPSPAPPLPVEVPAPGVRTDPFAIGILHTQPATPVYHRACDRLAIALAAREQGYFLLDTIEITSDPPDLSRALAVIEALALVTDADTFILRGTPPPGWLDTLATRLRMTIRTAARTARHPAQRDDARGLWGGRP